MKVKLKKLDKKAVIPQYAKDGDAGMDLVATSVKTEVFLGGTFKKVTYGTGLAIETPKGYASLLFPRSSIHKVFSWLCNSIGLIDSGYRGEIMVKMYSFGFSKNYEIGDRIAQIMIVPYPSIEFEEVAELSESERGDGGFGSTGS